MARKSQEYGTVHGVGLGWFICKLGLDRFLHLSTRDTLMVTSRPIAGERVTHQTEQAYEFSVNVHPNQPVHEIRPTSRCKGCTLPEVVDCVIPSGRGTQRSLGWSGRRGRTRQG